MNSVSKLTFDGLFRFRLRPWSSLTQPKPFLISVQWIPRPSPKHSDTYVYFRNSENWKVYHFGVQESRSSFAVPSDLNALLRPEKSMTCLNDENMIIYAKWFFVDSAIFKLWHCGSEISHDGSIFSTYCYAEQNLYLGSRLPEKKEEILLLYSHQLQYFEELSCQCTRKKGWVPSLVHLKKHGTISTSIWIIAYSQLEPTAASKITQIHWEMF